MNYKFIIKDPVGYFMLNYREREVKMSWKVKELDLKSRTIVIDEARRSLEYYIKMMDREQAKDDRKNQMVIRSRALQEAREESNEKYGISRYTAFQKLDELYQMKDYRSPGQEFFSGLNGKIARIQQRINPESLALSLLESRLLTSCEKAGLDRDSRIYRLERSGQLYEDRLEPDNQTQKLYLEELIKTSPLQNEVFECGFEFIAFYLPYHFYQEYGIYIKLNMLLNYLINIAKELRLEIREARDFALETVLTHMRFHHAVEMYLTNQEYYQGNHNLYYNYRKNGYQKYLGTDECLEETLANYFIKFNYTELPLNRIDFLNGFFERQPSGYREAAEINARNQFYHFNRFEKRLMRNKQFTGEFSHLLNIIIPLPLARLEVAGRLNIPVYLIDNISEKDHLNKLKGIMLPEGLKKPVSNGKTEGRESRLNLFK